MNRSRAVPSLQKYQNYLDGLAGLNDSTSTHVPLPPSLRVGIIGAGMSGLYSAILLQKHFPGVRVKLFDAADRVGGAVYTYRFSAEPNQYLEGGAMRVPYVKSHAPYFSLIDYLNKHNPEDPIELIKFVNWYPSGNRVLVNNTKQKDGSIMSLEYATKQYKELGFPDEATDSGNAGTLLASAFKLLDEAFERNFEGTLEKYKSVSMETYLTQELGWSKSKVTFVETMCCHTNLMSRGLLEWYFSLPNSQPNYFTIKDGMSKIPESCVELIKKNGGQIALQSKIQHMSQSGDIVTLGYIHHQSKDLIYEEFDAVIAAIPPPHLRAIQERPYFGQQSEEALRKCSFDYVSKFGMRFKSRFWERRDLRPGPSFGGQMVTDLPVRSLVLPTQGIGESGIGSLLVYNKGDDSKQWQLMSKKEKLEMTLQNLQQLYPEVDVAAEYTGGRPGDENYMKEALEVNHWGVVFYSPGQFLEFFPVIVKPQGNIYFAGAHLSSTLAWILSALESGRRAVGLLANRYGVKGIDFI